MSVRWTMIIWLLGTTHTQSTCEFIWISYTFPWIRGLPILSKNETNSAFIPKSERLFTQMLWSVSVDWSSKHRRHYIQTDGNLMDSHWGITDLVERDHFHWGQGYSRMDINWLFPRYNLLGCFWPQANRTRTLHRPRFWNWDGVIQFMAEKKN
jgi:hypothetical protein